MAAAIYLKRAGIYSTILEKNEPGGLLRHAFFIENYPGFPSGINGSLLVKLFIEQVQRLEISITKSEVHFIKHHDGAFLIETDHGDLNSSAIIVATGTIPKKLEIKGASSIEGIKLFYEPRSIPLGKKRVKKRILVIGGGDIAFDYTLTLLSLGHDVTIICRSKPTCLPLLYNRVLQNRASIRTSCATEEIVKSRNDILLRCRHNHTIEEFFADFILVACGREPNLSFLAPDLKKCINDVLKYSQTSPLGLFLAGDVIRGTFRQTGIAVGDGIHAAMMAEQYLRKKQVQR